jgi:phage protein D
MGLEYNWKIENIGGDMFNDEDFRYTARPRFEVNGEVQDLLAESLTSLTISESVTDMARCQARFSNIGRATDQSGFVFFENDLLAFGNELKVFFGDEREPILLFQGRITALEGLYPENSIPEIQVYAEDSLEALRHTRRSRTFHDVTDLDVISEIASEYGLQTEFSSVSVSPEQTVIAQLDQTDLAFLLGRARRMGADLWIDQGTLHLQEREFAEESHDLSLGHNLFSFRVRADLTEQVTELGVTGWDVANKEALDAVADDMGSSYHVFGGVTGSDLIDVVYGDRPLRLVRQVPLANDEARMLAEAQFLARAYRFVVGDGEAEGLPDLRAGKTVSLRGLGPWFDGLYHLVNVRHTYDQERGYRTAFAVERPALNEIPSSSYNRSKRRRKSPQRGYKKTPRNAHKKPNAGGEKKPKTKQGRESKPGKSEDPHLAETKVHMVLDDKRTPVEKRTDPEQTQPTSEKKEEGI